LNPLARGCASDGFDGGDLLADRGGHRCEARACRLSVDLDRAGAAQALTATELGPGHVQHVAQGPQERHVGRNIEVMRLAVYGERDHEGFPFGATTLKGSITSPVQRRFHWTKVSIDTFVSCKERWRGACSHRAMQWLLRTSRERVGGTARAAARN